MCTMACSPQADAWVRHLQRAGTALGGQRPAGEPAVAAPAGRAGAPATASRPGRGANATRRWPRWPAACGVDLVLLAHHRRDQAETFLLQALRGAGPAGLAAMPREALRDGIVWARPWLEQPREAIEAYVRRHRLGFVDDPSNADRRWRATACARQVWPALAASLRAGRDAAWRASAGARTRRPRPACASWRAARSARRLRTADGHSHVAAWLALSPARRANLLRAWLSGRPPPACRRRWCSGCCRNCRAHSAAPLAAARGGELRLHRGALTSWRHAGAAAAPWAPAHRPEPGRAHRRCPHWRGALRGRRRGAAAAWRRSALRRCELRARSGGERFQRAAGRAAAQPEEAVPGGRRAGLAARRAAGLCAAASCCSCPAWASTRGAQAQPATPMLGLRWVPDAAPERAGQRRRAAAVKCAVCVRSRAARRSLTIPRDHGTHRSQVRRHLDGLDRAHPQRRQARRQVGRAPATRWWSCPRP